MISHKIRGVSVGAPYDGRTESGYRSAKRYIFRIGGKPSYTSDAEAIFSFLFLYLPDGTMRELIRLFDEKLETISALSGKLEQREPSGDAFADALSA